MMPRTMTAVIANGAALSAAVYIGDGRLDSILMPAAWTAAALTFQGSYDGVNYFELFDDAGNALTVVSASAGANQMIQMAKEMYGPLWLIVRSGTSGTPVNQGAARTLTLMVRQDPYGRIR